MKIITAVKANHLAYIEPMLYGSRISADCQQNLLSRLREISTSNYSERIENRERHAQMAEITSLLENG